MRFRILSRYLATIVFVSMLILLLGIQVSVRAGISPNSIHSYQEIEVDEKSIEQQNESQGAYLLFVDLHQEMKADELATWVDNADLVVEQLIYRWREHTGAYSPKKGRTIHEAMADFKDDYQATLTSIQEQLKNEDDPLFLKGKDNPKAVQVSLNNEIEQIEQDLSHIDREGMTVSSLVFMGMENSLIDFVDSKETNISSYRIISVSDYREPKLPATSGEGNISDESSALLNAQSVAQVYTDPWKFAPENGWVRNNTSNNRMESVAVWWDTSGFDLIHRGYEHDITIWADKGDYVEPGLMQNYATNLPGGYADTTFMDDKANFTAGALNAENIVPGIAYWTSVPIVVTNGNYPNQGNNKDNIGGDILPQLSSWAGAYNDGEWPWEWVEEEFCYLSGNNSAPEWCLFADQTHIIGDPPYMYYDSGSAYLDFPFEHSLDRKYRWYKGYTYNWLQCPTGTFKGLYYNDQTGNIIFARCDDAPLSFDWGYDGPNHGLDDDDHFSIQWSGEFYFGTSGWYLFTVTSDDGVRVWVDGWNNLIIDGWQNQSATTYTGWKYLNQGFHPVYMKYYENTGKAEIDLTWGLVTQ